MSTHASTKVDQKEYLKKYLSGDKGKKKKEKKHKKEAKLKIIDDDLLAWGEQEVDETGEDAPQIVGEYVELQKDGGEGKKWRNIAVKEEEESEKVRVKSDEDLWGRKVSAALREVKGEFSPPRQIQQKFKKERRHRTPDISPPRRRAPNADHSTSPRRSAAKIKQRRRSSSAENGTHKSSGKKASPERKRRKSASVDQSPVRRRGNDSTDQSPVRRPSRKIRSRSPDQSPPRRRERKYSSDQSPPRRHSPSRRSRKSPSPNHRRRDSDQSPPRRRERSKTPPRIKREPRSSPKRSRWEAAAKPVRSSHSASPPPTHAKSKKTLKTLDGKTAGLQDARSLKQETEERRRHEDSMLTRMASDLSGRDAEVQVRSTGRRGKRARDAQAEDPAEQQRKEEREREKKELYERWGKGLKQIEDHRLRLEQQQYEGSKPLARHADDEDLERHLREQERADDPMLEYMRQRQKERQREKGAGGATVAEIPRYKGPYPENRFGIRPGYRWDGVDRSNGYEKKWFDVQNEKRALQDEAYKYSVEDM